MEAQILVFIFLPEADDDILLEIFRITAITLHTDFEPADILQKFTRKTQRAAIAPRWALFLLHTIFFSLCLSVYLQHSIKNR